MTPWLLLGAIGIANECSAELYSIRFARADSAPARLFIVDPEGHERIPIAFSVHLVREDTHLVLIDAGFEKAAQGWRIQDHRSVTELLEILNIVPQDVTDVIVTHGHWDHSDGLAHFSDARIWVSETLYRAARGTLKQTLKKAGDRLRRVSVRGQWISDAIRIIPVGLHTPGFQYVEVGRGPCRWIIASDLAPLRRNVTELKPTGQTSNPSKTLGWMREIINRVDGDTKRIIPSHDPGLFVDGPIVRHRLP